jgi:hypothetical protein
MMKRNIALLAFVAFAGFSTNSFAAGTTGFGIGGNIGYGLFSVNQTGASSQSGLAFGAELMYHIDPTWEVNVDWTMQSYPYATGSTFNNTFMTYMAELNYHLAADLNPLYFGIRLGLGTNASPNIAVSGVTVNKAQTLSSFGFGVQAGYDYSIISGLSIGPKLAFTYLPSFSVNNTSVSAVNFQALASVRYEF